MMYLTGYTEQEADHWGGVFLNLAQTQLRTDATEWGKVQLTDGSWAVPLDEHRKAIATIPEELLTRLSDRMAEGRLKSREELQESGLWPADPESDSDIMPQPDNTTL